MNAALLADARRELGHMPGVLDGLLGGLDAESGRTRPAPGEWSPVEVVCHLRDEETGDFVRIEPERWAEERRYREVALPEALAAFRERREETLDLLRSIEPQALDGARAHRRLGRLSGLDILAAWVAHDRIHLAQLAATLARVWTLRWAPLRSEYAGPIPYAPETQP